MILSISCSNPGHKWETRLGVDFGARRWAAQAGSPAWRKVTQALSGPISASTAGDLQLLDGASKPLMVLEIAPRREGDVQRPFGSGRILASADTSLLDATVVWGQRSAAGADGLSDVRRKALELIDIHLPTNGVLEPPNCVEGAARTGTGKNASGFRATGCGGLAGWYFKQLLAAGFPVTEARVRKSYEWTPPGKTKKEWATEDLYLTGPTFGHDIIVKELQKSHERPVYIDFKGGSGLLPQPGDVYFIRTAGGLSRHVGVFVGADEKGWRTADGGQGPSGYGVGMLSRRFNPLTGAITGGKEVGFVPGWIDLDLLLELGPPVAAA